MVYTEAQLQRACVRNLRASHPAVITYRGHEGQQLAGAQRWRQLAAYRLARLEGRTKGAPDLLIALRGRDGKGALAIEFKTRTGKVSAEQAAAMAHLENQNIRTAVVRSEEEFAAALADHLVGGAPVVAPVVVSLLSDSDDGDDDDVPDLVPRPLGGPVASDDEGFITIDDTDEDEDI